MTFFNGEQIVVQDIRADEPESLPPDIRDNNHKNVVAASAHGGPNTRRLGEDQPCGGGRRVIRKRIGD